MSLNRFIIVCLALTAANVARAADSDTPDFAPLAKEYDTQTHPLLKQFCTDCHATADPEGELDLERFATLQDVRRAPTAWQKVAEMLDNGEMPPKDADQPSLEQRKRRGVVVSRQRPPEQRQVLAHQLFLKIDGVGADDGSLPVCPRPGQRRTNRT